MGKLGKSERILVLLADIRENSGVYNSRMLADKYRVNQKMILSDLQLAGKYGFVKHDRKLKKYIYTGK